MKRIAFYSREFRLCKWPEKPTTSKFDDGWNEYYKAVTSAMENGVRFEDQEQVRIFICELNPVSPGTYQKKFVEGDNWPAPEGAEIENQKRRLDGLIKDWVTWPYSESIDSTIYETRNIAVLKSESVEKKVEKEMKKEGYSKVKHMDDSEFSDHYKLVLLRDFVEKEFSTFIYWDKEKKNWACRNLTTPESSPEKEVGAVIYSFGYEASQSTPAPLESQEELWKKVFSEHYIGMYDDGGYDTRIVRELSAKFILTRRTEGDLVK